jgi:hypothetical protein
MLLNDGETMGTYTAGKRWGSAFIQGKRVGNMYKGGKCIYSADSNVVENLTTWHPKWAKIDYEAGSTTFTYTDVNGATVTPGSSSSYSSVACIGNRTNGAVYYYASNTMYKKNIVNGVIGNAEVLWTSDWGTFHLRINEETGAAGITNGSTSFRIAPSVEELGDAATLTTGLAGFEATGHGWRKGLIQMGQYLFNSQGEAVRQLPSNIGITSYNSCVLEGNDTDGWFIHTGAHRFFAYDWESNTAEQIFTTTTQNVSDQTGMRTVNQNAVIDAERGALLFGIGGGVGSTTEDRTVWRTSDGITLIPVAGTLGGYGGWVHSFFPHVNFNVRYRNYWNGNTDTVGGIAANCLFPGMVSSDYFYAGKYMLVNGTRLWEIVPR